MRMRPLRDRDVAAHPVTAPSRHKKSSRGSERLKSSGKNRHDRCSRQLLWRHTVGLAQLLGRVTPRDQSGEPPAHEQLNALDGKTRFCRKAAYRNGPKAATVQKSRSLDLWRKVSEVQLHFPGLISAFLRNTVHLGKSWCGTSLALQKCSCGTMRDPP